MPNSILWGAKYTTLAVMVIAFVTVNILTGIGHLQKLQALPPSLADKIKEIVMAALPYLDDRIRQDYEDEKKWDAAATAGKAWIETSQVESSLEQRLA